MLSIEVQDTKTFGKPVLLISSFITRPSKFLLEDGQLWEYIVEVAEPFFPREEIALKGETVDRIFKTIAVILNKDSLTYTPKLFFMYF